MPERPECPLCGSRMMAALKPWEEEEIKIAKKRRTNRKRKEKNGAGFQEREPCSLTGKLLRLRLPQGVWAWDYFKGYRELRVDEGEFYWDILITERNYAKTKRFWE